MITGKTKTGFEFKIKKNALQNIEVLELIARIQNNDGLAVFPLLEKLLGKEQKTELYEHIRNDEGEVLLDDLAPELDLILDALNEDAEGKNC